MPILVAYNEIALKSRYVRTSLERLLCSQIEYSLHRAGFAATKVKRRWGRIVIEDVPNEAAELISKVFGVAHSIPSQSTTSELESIKDLAIKIGQNKIPSGGTFAVRAKVVGVKPYGSMELAKEIGSALLGGLNNLEIKVNLTKPDTIIHIEVRDDDAFVYTDIINGVGGLPYGSQGKGISLFSGGIDSPVASWLMMKRGIEILPLFMDQTPLVGKSYIDRAKEAFVTIRNHVPTKNFYLYIAPMGIVMEKILKHKELRFTCILCKRAMYRIAEAFSKEHDAKGIVTGESLGQVASQTLDNLFVLDSSVRLPIFRPLIGLDKVEIENIARRIGTYTITAKRVEGCKAVPNVPATTSRIEKIESIEQELDLPVLCENVASNIMRVDLC